MSYLVISPRYGRDYTGAKAVLDDWLAGKDFTVESFGPDMGRAISIREAESEGLSVQIRYARLTKCIMVKPGNPKGGI